MSKSEEYWRERELEQDRKNIKSEEEMRKRLGKIYQEMLDSINKEIEGFYARYAKAEGITMAEARKRASTLDTEEYERKAKKYVEERDFSKTANEEMRLYNMAMKVNRLELLKAKIAMELAAGFSQIEKMYAAGLNERIIKEYERLAGILGGTAKHSTERARALVNASFRNATFSERIWMYQGMLKAELDTLLAQGIIQGKHPTELARHLKKRFGVNRSAAETLMITEMRRVQTEAQKESFERNGFDQYKFLAHPGMCPACKKINGKTFPVKDMMPGKNAPPMHPRCRCSTCAYIDSDSYEEWLDTYKTHRMTYEQWKKR